MDLTVEIDGAISTLEDALHRFTSKEILDGDNKYHCIRLVHFVLLFVLLFFCFVYITFLVFVTPDDQLNFRLRVLLWQVGS
jgi:hypothetical protein